MVSFSCGVNDGWVRFVAEHAHVISMPQPRALWSSTQASCMQEQQAEGETGEAGSSGQQGNPDEGQQRELQLDMQTTEGQMEKCARSTLQCPTCWNERLQPHV